MGGWVRTRESHQDVKGPTGPRGRLAERSTVGTGTLADSRSQEWRRRYGGRSAEKVRLSEAGEPGAQRSGRR